MSLITSWIVALFFLFQLSISILGFGLAFQTYARRYLQMDFVRTWWIVGLGLFLFFSLIVGLAYGYHFVAQAPLSVVGIYFFFRYRKHLFEHSHFPKSWDRIWLLFPAVYFLTRFFSAGLPQQHSDPLYYHLAAPKLWVDAGVIFLSEANPSLSQATFWEVLYGIPQFWLGTTGEWSHVTMQILGQWLHMFWGQIGCVIVGALLLRNLAPILESRPGLSIFLAWICTTIPSVEWTGTLAKNDYIITLFALGATLSAINRKVLVAGLLAGFAISTKILACWVVAALLIFIPPRKWIQYGSLVLIAYLPILIRNIVWTKNPVFPLFESVLGPGWISEVWNAHNATFGGAPEWHPEMWGWLKDKLFEKALPKILLGIGFIALIAKSVLVLSQKRHWFSIFGAWIGFLVSQFFFLILTIRPQADGRYGNYMASLLFIFLMSVVIRFGFNFKFFQKYAVYALLPLGAFINSPVDVLWKVPKYWGKPAIQYVEEYHPYFKAKRWLNDNAPKDSVIVAVTDKANFYLDHRFETVSEVKRWEELFQRDQSYAELKEAIKAAGFRYIYYQTDFVYPSSYIGKYWDEILKSRPNVAFSTHDTMVVDLQ